MTLQLAQHAISTLTDEERDYVRACVKRAGFRLALKECFMNSQKALLMGDTEKRLTYAEGLATTKTGPVPHGWLLLDGKVVDLTWGGQQLGIRTYLRKKHGVAAPDSPAPAFQYRGATFERTEVLAFMQREGWGSMLETLDLMRAVGAEVPEATS